MKFWLAVLCTLTLNCLDEINATKKEDLERAAELAVERAAERVAERAVEKALEAGNSSTTTVTVKEGYSNARKVAEEQAAPGSESTRYPPQNPQYPIEYSGEEGEGSRQVHSGEYEYAEEENVSKQTSSKEELTESQEASDAPTYGLKENARVHLKKLKPKEYENHPKRPIPHRDEEVEEETYTEGGDLDESHETKAWKDYSSWENKFKSAATKENWTERNKPFWSAEDSFFWDMDDAESRNHLRTQRNLTFVEPRAGESENHMWKNQDSSKEFFSWDNIKTNIYSTTKRPESQESEVEKVRTEPKKFEFPAFWSNEKSHDSFEKSRKSKKSSEPDWSDPVKVLFKNNNNDDLMSDSSTEKDFWGNEKKKEKSNPWVEKSSESKEKVKRKREPDFWAELDDSKSEEMKLDDSKMDDSRMDDSKMDESGMDDSKMEKEEDDLKSEEMKMGESIDVTKLNEFLDNESWESSKEPMEEKSDTDNQETTTINSEAIVALASDDASIYTAPTKKEDDLSNSQESGGSSVIASQAPFYDSQKYRLNKTNSYFPKSANYAQKFKFTSLESTESKTKGKSTFPRPNRFAKFNLPLKNDADVYRIRSKTPDVRKMQVSPRTTSSRRLKMNQPANEPYTGYVLSAYKPQINPYEFNINQLRHKNQFATYRMKKQLPPLYYERSYYPYQYASYKLQRTSL